MFVASAFLSRKWAGITAGQIGSSAPLNHLECAQLAEPLKADGTSCLYSSLVSIADAIRGIEAGFYSWGGVKLYYSVFYALRASLAFSGIAIFYANNKPYWIEVRPGRRPQKPPQGAGSSSHKLVLKLFAVKESGSTILSQPIDGIEPLDWLQNVREELNYRNAKFVEPECPVYFRHVAGKTVRRLATAYLSDTTYEFAFDVDHSLLAYPIEVLKYVVRHRSPTSCFDDDERENLKSMMSDRLGRLSCFDAIVNV